MQFVSGMICHFLTKQYLFIVGDRNTCCALALIISDDSLIRSVSNGSVMDLSAFHPHLSFPDTSLTLQKQNLHHYWHCNVGRRKSSCLLEHSMVNSVSMLVILWIVLAFELIIEFPKYIFGEILNHIFFFDST